MDKKDDINKFLERMEKLKKEHDLDLSLDEDLSIAIMNLVSLEEHFFFTGAKTGKDGYYDLLEEVREMRKELLKKIVKDPEGEQWCISKHLLATSMRLMEVGTKSQSRGKKKEAENFFQKAYDLYSLFWGINLKIVEMESLKRKKEPQVDKRLNKLVEDLIDCCEE